MSKKSKDFASDWKSSIYYQFSEEIDFSIELNEKAAFVLSYGIEKILGNTYTDKGDSEKSSSSNGFLKNWALKIYRYTNYRNQKYFLRIWFRL